LNEAGIPLAAGSGRHHVMRMLKRLDPFREEEAAA
jgi:hypothetical protein